mmetsp:Transcript_16316/g.24181  ORF Transcript_16316/g.24181 Transcript_16316/m.24181 type:complete len:114 (+) Transcript_16316:351-692(+)
MDRGVNNKLAWKQQQQHNENKEMMNKGKNTETFQSKKQHRHIIKRSVRVGDSTETAPPSLSRFARQIRNSISIRNSKLKIQNSPLKAGMGLPWSGLELAKSDDADGDVVASDL